LLSPWFNEKYSWREPIGFLCSLQVRARSWIDIRQKQKRIFPETSRKNILGFLVWGKDHSNILKHKKTWIIDLSILWSYADYIAWGLFSKPTNCTARVYALTT
jgi:hypothetical protein